jgi:protease-4
VVSLLRGLSNVLRTPFLPVWWLLRLLGRPRSRWLVVQVGARLSELDRPRPLLVRLLPKLGRALPTSLATLRRLAQHAGDDRHVTGVVLVIPQLMAGWAECKGLRDVIAALRERGKEVAVYLPEGGGNREIYVATAAERIWMPPEATLMPLGLAAVNRYLRPVLDRLGVEVEAFARAEYKTAVEPFVRESMSDAQREQLTALLETFQDELVQAMAARPGMTPDSARGLFARAFLRGRDAVEAGLIDGVCYEDELTEELVAGSQQAPPPQLLPAGRYLAYREARFFVPLRPAPYIAVVPIRGPIVDSAPAGRRSRADRHEVVQAIRAARKDRRAVGVLLYINSPGGSATASDLIHREVVRLAETKPVVAFMGDVAASGGYYVAAPCHAIVAQPVTITGSIGVVSARILLRDVLERVGIRTEVVRLAPHADMFSPHRALESEERQLLEGQLDAFYQGFVDVVARGRGRSRDEVEPLARGRVWSGAAAADRGLVDELGGFELAAQRLAERADVPSTVRPRLGARVVSPPRGVLPPAPPPSSSPADRLAERLLPELRDWLAVSATGDRVAYYAPWLPRIE